MRDWQKLSAILLEATAERVAEQGRPTWVRVFDELYGEDDGYRLELSPDPDALLGWVAPEDCIAVGVIATGQLRPVVDVAGYTGTGPPGSSGRIEMACLLGRDTTIGWTVHPSDGAPPEAPTAGRMVDCLRRCFAQPTPPAPVDPAQLMAVAWLVSIMEKNTGVGRNRLTWSEVSRLHPLARVVAGDFPTESPNLLSGLCRLAASAWTWEDYRTLASRDDCLGELCDPELAAWMDEGMFARWILAELPSAEEAMVAARSYLVPSAARRLAHAVHGAARPPTRAVGADGEIAS